MNHGDDMTHSTIHNYNNCILADDDSDDISFCYDDNSNDVYHMIKQLNGSIVDFVYCHVV